MNQVPDWGQVAALVVAGVFLLMSGLVSASEAAFFSLLPSDVQVLKDSARQRDRMLVSLLGRSDRMLTSLQIADVFLNVGFVALCAYGLDAWIDGASSPAWWLVAEVFGLTLLLLNLGEILPKVLARRNALSGVRRMAVVLAVTYRVVAPFTNIVVRYTAAVNRRMERKKKELSVDDLSQALEMTAPEVKEEKEISGSHGVRITCDRTIGETEIGDADVLFLPGWPEVWVIVMPAASPVSASCKEVTGFPAILSDLTVSTDPVRFTFFCVP